LQTLLGWIAPHSDALNNLNANGPFSSNPLTGHADGGWTGDVPTNKVAGFVHGQEFVIKAGPAAQYRSFGRTDLLSISSGGHGRNLES